MSEEAPGVLVGVQLLMGMLNPQTRPVVLEDLFRVNIGSIQPQAGSRVLEDIPKGLYSWYPKCLHSSTCS